MGNRTIRLLIRLCAAACCGDDAATAEGEQTLASRLVGHWNLVSVEAVTGQDTEYPFGRDVSGVISYDAAGHVAVQIMRANRPFFASGDQAAGTPAGLVEPRGNFIYENPVMVSALAGSVASHGSYRTLLFPTGTPLGVPTDAGMFAREGYPVSSLISGPVWLFDDDDTLERVAVQELAPLSAMYIDFIGRLDRLADPLLRFNLNVWTVIITAALLIPLATLSAAHWPRKEA